jgi:pilus assembly protein CpaC
MRSGWPTRIGIIGVASIILAGLMLLAPAAPAAENEFPNHITVTGADDGKTRPVKLGLGKSVVVDLPRAARDVLIANPSVADAVVRTQHKSFIIAREVGQTNVFFFDADGRQIVAFDVEVVHDVKTLKAMFDRLLPTSDIQVDAIGEAIVLSGTAANAAEADKAVRLASQFVSSDGGGGGGGGVIGGATAAVATAAAGAGAGGGGGSSKIVNMISIAGKDQVALKVTVAEMSRSTLKQLGVNLNAALQMTTTTVLNFTSINPFTLTSATPSSEAGVDFVKAGGTCLLVNDANDACAAAVLRALERNGLFRTLAEPVLTSISGETASFLAGGEFPVPIGRDGDGNVVIEFKPFGVKLAFTPVVLDEGLISLKIGAEVSELSNDNGLVLVNATVPGLKVRRTQSTVELPSGGSIVLAGLIKEETKQELNGFPGLKNLPVLGALFRSREFTNEETELVVIATPYIVQPTGRAELAQPDEGFAQPSDHEATLMGRLNAVYGHRTGERPSGRYQGSYGFIVK